MQILGWIYRQLIMETYVYVNFNVVPVPYLLFLVYIIFSSLQEQSGSTSFHADPGGFF